MNPKALIGLLRSREAFRRDWDDASERVAPGEDVRPPGRLGLGGRPEPRGEPARHQRVEPVQHRPGIARRASWYTGPVRALLLATVLVARTAAAAPLPFLEDDWPRAASEARARGVPVFVDAWAPW